MSAMFEVVTRDNSQHITLNDNAGHAPNATWIIGQGTKAIAWAVMTYARTNHIHPTRVGYAVRPTRHGEA